MATAAPKKTKVAALRVVAKRDSFRRCGRRFGPEAVDIPLSELKPADKKTDYPGELALLKADPMLVCHEVEIEVEDAEGDAK